MSTRVMKIPYPEDLPAIMGKTPEQFEQELRFLVAAKFYEMGRVSSGRAAELAGINRVEFLNNLSQYRVSVFNYSLDELEREIREAKNRAKEAA